MEGRWRRHACAAELEIRRVAPSLAPPGGVAELSAGIAVRTRAGVLVTVGGGRGERPHDNPVEVERLPAHLEALAEAGADEAILVLDPIDAATVERVAAMIF